jgi:hypothetical protein
MLAIVLICLLATLHGQAPATTRAATAGSPSVARWPTVTVTGLHTTWTLTVTAMRKMNQIPQTQCVCYKANIWTFWVINLRATNIGSHAASIFGDLQLALKILPKYQTYGTSGWTTLLRQQQYTAMMETAAKVFGGAVSWQITQPHQTTAYCYVIGARRGESHYGFYNVSPTTTTFLFDTGF